MILVTGGAGFIGSNLCQHLISKGYKIRVIDNGLNNATKGYGDMVWADIRQDIDGLWDDVSTVVHLAAVPGVELCSHNEDEAWSVNAEGTKHLIEQAYRHGVKRVVLASSVGAVLGVQEQPAREEQIPAPQTVYGNTKRIAETYILEGRVSSCVLRFTNVYGEYSQCKNSVVPKLLRHDLSTPFTIYGSGEQIRDFVYVGDVCRAIVKAMETEVTGIYHVGSGQGTKLLDLVAEVEKVRQQRIPLEFVPSRQGDVEVNVASVAQAKNILGWEALIPLQRGLTACWQGLNIGE